MDPVNAAILILIGSFFLLMIIRVPITFALGISAFLTISYLGLEPMAVVLKMADGGIAMRLINFANLFVGRIRGGLAMVNILASMFFGGISGSSVADTASIGSILIPMMKKKGYDADFAVGVTITGSTQGIIIPPSHNAIIYALAAGGAVSIGKLFLGGYIPGIMVGISLMTVSYIIAVIRKYPKGDKIGAKNALKIAVDAFWGLITAVIVVGAVIFGIATATESSAVAVVYAFIITFFVYREIGLKKFGDILLNSVKTISMVMMLIATASAFGFMLAYLGVPGKVAAALSAVSTNKIVILLLINIMLLVLGCIMDMAPLILIVTPVLLPVAVGVGMDPVQFGIMLMLNLGIGLCTPPVGSTLFVGCAIGKVSIEKMARSLWPFLLTMMIVLMLITYVPWFTMWLPGIAMK
ncbi:MAG: TRAP transporter large permease [bacterium]